MAVFFASVLPQFTAPRQAMVSALVLLGAVFSALTFAWLTVYATVIPTAGRLRLSRPARDRGRLGHGLDRAGRESGGGRPLGDQPLFAIAAARRFSSSGGTSSLWVPMCQW